jgi:hypothetical protein
MGETCVNPDWAVIMEYYPPRYSSDERTEFYFNNKVYAIQFASANNVKVQDYGWIINNIFNYVKTLISSK